MGSTLVQIIGGAAMVYNLWECFRQGYKNNLTPTIAHATAAFICCKMFF